MKPYDTEYKAMYYVCTSYIYQQTETFKSVYIETFACNMK